MLTLSQTRLRLLPACVTILGCLVVGVVTHVVRKSVPGADFAGGALYTLCWAVLLWLVTRPLLAAAGAWLISCAVELSQLHPAVGQLSTQSTFFRLALGQTFDPMDFVSYTIGLLAAVVVLPVLTRRMETG